MGSKSQQCPFRLSATPAVAQFLFSPPHYRKRFHDIAPQKSAADSQKKRKRNEDDAAPKQQGIEKKQKTASGSHATKPGHSTAVIVGGKKGKQAQKQKQKEPAEDKMDEDSDASDQRALDRIMNGDDDDMEEAGLSDEDASSMDDDEEDDGIDISE